MTAKPSGPQPVNYAIAPDRGTVERMFHQGIPVKSICKVVGRSPKTLRKWLDRWGLKREPIHLVWSPERLARMVELYEAGWSMPRIANRLGTTAAAVDSQLRNHQIPRRGQAASAPVALPAVECVENVAVPFRASVEVRAMGADTAARFAALMARTVAHHRAKRAARNG